MRKTLGWACIAAVAVLGLSVSGAAASKRTSRKSAAAATRKAPARNKGAAGKTAAKKPSSKKSASKKRSARPAPRTTWRNRQLTPAPERCQEIQQALATKGYLDAAEANGVWGQSSVAALKRFQEDQRIETTGKINSLSLIALGLGPKRDASAATPPAAPAAEPQ